MILKIMKLLLKIEKWALDKCIEKDTLEYEDYLYSIKKHEKEIEMSHERYLQYLALDKAIEIVKRGWKNE